jgi:transcriptional regulator with XRE-family HTH domain
MADVLGVATSMYNMYETRQRRMYVETFATLCSYFGVSADDLLGTGKEE